VNWITARRAVRLYYPLDRTTAWVKAQTKGSIMSGSLFRSEAVEYRRRRAWAGSTTAPPMAMWLLTAFLATSVTATGIFLSVGTYAQKETVPGYLTPVTGTAKLMPDAPGVVAELNAVDGDTVAAGQRLLLIRTEHRGAQDPAVNASVMDSLKAKRAAIMDRIEIEQRAAQGQRQALSETISGLQTEVATLAEALRNQRQRVQVAHDQVEAVRTTVSQGVTSVTEFRRRQDTELSQHQAEIELYRQIAAKAVEVRTKQYALSELESKTADNLAALRGSMADVETSLTEAQVKQGYIVTAPIAGRITSLQAWVGMRVETGVPLMSIVPNNTPLEVSMLLPARAVGFIVRGQPVYIAFDAYPFQRFGFYKGTIVSVSDTLLKPSEAIGPMTAKEASYRAVARLERQTITAYDREVQLRPDMLLKADIIIDRRSLIQWLFDPLLSARGRGRA
jgi:membrane fusion protein